MRIGGGVGDVRHIEAWLPLLLFLLMLLLLK